MRSILIFGGAGLIGGEICRLAVVEGRRCRSLFRAVCDIADRDAVERAIRSASADVSINCAAYNAVDRAESEPDIAMRANAVGPANIAMLSPRVVHFSSDCVFGAESDEPHDEDAIPSPVSAYGRSKAAGDEAVAKNPNHHIVRVANVYGARGRGLGSTLRARLSRGERLRIDAERRIQPTWARLVAEQTLFIADNAPFGIYNVTCQGETTWAGFAEELARLSGLNPRLIDPVSTATLQTAAVRPRNALLGHRKLTALHAGKNPMPHWKDALATFLEQ